MDMPSKKKINREILDLNCMLDQMDITDIYRTFHPTAAQYTFFSMTHGTFSTIERMLGHKTNLNKFKNIKIILSIFSVHNCMELEISDKTKTGKFTNIWRKKNRY